MLAEKLPIVNASTQIAGAIDAGTLNFYTEVAVCFLLSCCMSNACQLSLVLVVVLSWACSQAEDSGVQPAWGIQLPASPCRHCTCTLYAKISKLLLCMNL